MNLQHWVSAAALLGTLLLGIALGRSSGNHIAMKKAGWIRPAVTVNEQTERFNRLHHRVTAEGDFELVWLDDRGEDGLDKAGTPALVAAADSNR